MKYHSPDGMTVEIVDLSTTSQSEATKLTNLSDGLWLLVKNANLTVAGWVKFPPMVAALARAQDESGAVTTFLATALDKYGIDLADLRLECRPSPST